MASSIAAGRVLKGMLRRLERSWWTVVAGLALGLTLGVVLLEQFPERYRAQLALPAVSGSLQSTPLDPATIDRLARRVGARDRAALRASLEYLVDGEGERRLISAVAADAPRASAIVDHWAHILSAQTDGSPGVVTVAAVEPPAATLFLLLGTVIGLALFVGPMLVRGAIDPLIWDAVPMRELAQPLFAIIPSIPTPVVRAERRGRLLVNFGLSGICLAILSVAVLTHVR